MADESERHQNFFQRMFRDFGEPAEVDKWLDLGSYTGPLPPAAGGVSVVADQAARLALLDDVGQVAIQTDIGEAFRQLASPASSAANWEQSTVDLDTEVASTVGVGGTVNAVLSDHETRVTTNDAKVSADGSVTTHSDVTDAGSGAIITTAERTKVGHISVTQAVDLDTIESDTATNNAKVSADGSVTTHSDVTDAGSGAIITAGERTAITHSNRAELDLISDGDHDVRTDNPHGTTLEQAHAAGNVITATVGDGPLQVNVADDWTTNPNSAAMGAVLDNGADALAGLLSAALDGANPTALLQMLLNPTGTAVNGGVTADLGGIYIQAGPNSTVTSPFALITAILQGTADFIWSADAQAGATLNEAVMLLKNTSGDAVEALRVDQREDAPGIVFANPGGAHGDAADIRLATLAADPTAPANGDVWYKDRPKARVAGATEQLAFTGELLSIPAANIISPAALTANTNNWNPTGLATARIIRISSTTNIDLTGIAAPTTARIIHIHNVSSNNIKLKMESGSSLAANRFATKADITMEQNESVVLVYDTVSARWRVSAFNV